jgi:acetoin utilization deacetylase AcuC-like enzyme
MGAEPIAGTTLIEPSPLTADAIAVVHDHEYVEAVRTGEPRDLSESNGFPWDAGMWDAVCASNGGAVAAALTAFRSRAHAGSLSSGLHHAKARHGDAYCTFNGLALAAHAVLAAGAKQVLILDLDAHCGGGTDSIVRTWPGVVHLDIAVSPVDRYAPDEAGPSTFDLVSDAGEYLPTLRARLAALGSLPFDVVIYNAGMDVHQDCGVGGLDDITTAVLAERERVVFDWARTQGVPVAFVLAGGYEGRTLQRDTLVDLHRLTIAAAALSGAPNSGGTA